MEYEITEGVKLLINSDKEHVFKFSVHKDSVMNANGMGYAKTPRQQAFLNHKRNEARKALVEMGKSVKWTEEPIEHAICICEIANLTNGRFDPPNLEPTEKHLIDGLVQAGVLKDDAVFNLPATIFTDTKEDKNKESYIFIIRLLEL